MNWNALAAIAELLGAIAVVASLLYLAVQIRQNTRQSRLAAQQATVHELGRVLQGQAQNREWADLLSRGLENLDALDDIERTQFLSHVGHILRLYESTYFYHLEGTLDSRFWRGFENAIADVVSYEGFAAAVELRRHHLSSEFAEYLSEAASTRDTRPIFGEKQRESPRY